MIRRLSIALLAAAGLSGCVSSGYGYRGATGGDYYHGRGSSYGAPHGYGYGGVGYGYGGVGYGYRDPYFSYGGYGYPYYGYAPAYPYPRRGHVDQTPRRVMVPNKPISGFDYPPGATVFPNKPGNVSQGRPTGVIGVDPGQRGASNPKLDRGPRVRMGSTPVQSAPAPASFRGADDRPSRISAPASRPMPAPRPSGGARNRIRDARP